MSNTAATTTTTSPSKGGKYLTFSLGKEEFGLGILAVREIIGYMDVTLVPRTPSYVRGVINLRGQVISVIDLRAKFGMESADRTDRTCIVVVEINNGGRRLSTGLIVDRVSEVLTVPAENIEEAPDFGANVRTDFILGMGKVGSSVKILLNIDRVLGAEEIEALAGAAVQAA
jgi:purine-binding chemotaxis protein CheW